MLNDTFVLGQAKFWGERVAAVPGRMVDETLRSMFLEALSREPEEAELARWRGLVEDLALERGATPEGVAGSAEVWGDVGHALFNTKEFLYLR